MKQRILKIALDTPLDQLFDYVWLDDGASSPPRPGQLAMVPFGKREAVGLIIAIEDTSDVPPDKLKPVLSLRAQLEPLRPDWIALCSFAADYYQRPLGEVVIPGIPKNLRAETTVSLDRALKRLAGKEHAHDPAPANMPPLNAAQREAAEAIAAAEGFAPILLYGVTGSGKTEVYLQAAARILAKPENHDAQVLILTPEINLTPQLEANVRARFPGVDVVTLHSGLAEGERLQHWIAAHLGRARIILGTRLAVLASLPALKLIIIDEEHDPSYKQQEGLRYSARDLAVWRARQLDIPLVLGSATPSLETWHHARTGRYRELTLRERAVPDAVLPAIRLVDMERDKADGGLTASLRAAIKKRLDQGEQSLLFLNRRGYAPVLSCESCGWISNCVRCTAFMVLHKSEHRLRCHHCSMEQRIPRACPTCGNVDLQPLGRGTQRIEENLQHLFPEARLLRIDADSTRLKGSAQAAFDAVHRGEVDILIGTQMVAKGHDFRNLTLVGVLNPDTALFSHDYRASERLFAQLMQVGGRAGRAARKEDGNAAEVLIQTRYPQHPLYAALMAHDYDRFAAGLLEERQQAGLPPYLYQALLRAEARELDAALAFLQEAAGMLQPPGITINDPIPMALTRVANVERAQLLVESPSRPALQAYLREWMLQLRAMKSRVKWSLEVDPMDI
ncbi:primosomal protein N' [Noviherbaspirillum galbum]|uniref:Replication restart protein PriA n=1 Tax=Noviherbaspirillum galbum TaxID=2709383 RepID=A0A6B3SWU4_9BURK|nr:primosomal protein N' [Noviherbaspirillum galbum]NEX63486.1 primosomal protein N' [Noviherbaspirillum galbum]